MKDLAKITFVILGAIIGAGFISGQEINLFFNQFKTYGIVGIIISGSLIGIIIKKVCEIINEKNILNFQDFINEIIPINNKYFKLILNNIIEIFLLISFFIMCAAFNSFFKQEFGIPIYIIGIITFLICYIVLQKENVIIIKINEIMMPIIIVLIVYLFFKNNLININYEIDLNKNLFQALISGIIYASYNVILLIPLLITLNKFLKNKKQIHIFSIICGLSIIILELIMFLLINTISDNVKLEIPLIYISNKIGMSGIYGVAILVAIFTTMITLGYSFLKNTSKSKKNYKIKLIVIGILSIFISYIGFTNLINLLYPIFGLIGILQIIFILKY